MLLQWLHRFVIRCRVAGSEHFSGAGSQAADEKSQRQSTAPLDVTLAALPCETCLTARDLKVPRPDPSARTIANIPQDAKETQAPTRTG
jgi:hypothetical protein